jgi:hypothetical protein
MSSLDSDKCRAYRKNSKRAKRSVKHEMIPGSQCFSDWMVQASAKPTLIRRRKVPASKREASQEVKKMGACLRCQFYKIRVSISRSQNSCQLSLTASTKCSLGRLCTTCKQLLDQSYGRRQLQWTECVSSNFLDVNIFKNCRVISVHLEQ